MFYRVYADDKLIWEPRAQTEELDLIDPELEMEVGSAGCFTCTIPESNINYGAFSRGSTTITIKAVDDNLNEEIIWRGRPIRDVVNVYLDKEMECEGEQAYLNDTLCRPSDPDDTYEDDVQIPLWLYLACLIAEHNYYASPNRRFHFDCTVYVGNYCSEMTTYINYCKTWFNSIGTSTQTSGVYTDRPNFWNAVDSNTKWAHLYLGNQTNGAGRWCDISIASVTVAKHQHSFGCNVEPTNSQLVTLDVSGYPTTMDQIQSLVDEYEGYIIVKDHYVYYKRDGDSSGPYQANYVEDTTNGHLMPVLYYLDAIDEIGDQPLIFGENISNVTVEADCSEMFTCLVPTGKEDSDSGFDGTIKSIAGVDYIYSPMAVDTFGWITQTKSFNDATDASTTMAQGISWLESHLGPKWTLEMDVIDMGVVSNEYDPLKFGLRYNVTAESLGVNTSFILTGETLKLRSPKDNTYKFTTEAQAFTDEEFQNGMDTGDRVNSMLNTTRNSLISKYQNSDQPMLAAIAAALKAGTATVEWTADDGRLDLNSDTYKTAGKSYRFSPTVAQHTDNSPFGTGSFLLVTVYSSVGMSKTFQVAFTSVNESYCLYRRFANGWWAYYSSYYNKPWTNLDLTNTNSVWNASY